VGGDHPTRVGNLRPLSEALSSYKRMVITMPIIGGNKLGLKPTNRKGAFKMLLGFFYGFSHLVVALFATLRA